MLLIRSNYFYRFFIAIENEFSSEYKLHEHTNIDIRYYTIWIYFYMKYWSLVDPFPHLFRKIISSILIGILTYENET